MDFISSKNIFLLTRDTLKLLDKQVMKHGSRTGYILYKMLEEKGGYEKFELAELVMLATLHDIGAYKTDDLDNMLFYESKHYLPHSIYGFLFLKYLSPLSAHAKILLYHHVDYEQLEGMDYADKELAGYLNLAEKIDIYRHALGDRFDYNMLRKYEGLRFSKEALDLFGQAQLKYDLATKIQSQAYEQELDELMDYIMFTNEEKRKYMEMLMYCIGFRSEYKVVDSVTTICICELLAEKLHLDRKVAEKLFYGALIHDIGMLAIPNTIIETDRRLTPEEIERMRTHVNLAQQILSSRVNEEVVEIAVRHHERVNGSGYPGKLRGEDMTTPQKILQLADTVTGLSNERSYRETRTREQILQIMRTESFRQEYDKQILDIFLLHYDEIMQEAARRSKEILQMHRNLLTKFEGVHVKMGETGKAAT